MRTLKNVFKRIRNWYENLTFDVKRFIPIAINVVEAIKWVTDSNVDDIIAEILKSVIPGVADDIIIDQIKNGLEKWIPILLIQLNLVNEISQIENKNDQLVAIINHFNLSSDEARSSFYHNFATLILEKLSDGKLTKSECIILTEYYYNERQKK